MAIKISKYLIFLVIILSTLLLNILVQVDCVFISSENRPTMNSRSDLLINKVYNFTVDRPFIYFHENIFLEASYNYYITLCIVTPHSCDMNITLWDPKGEEYCLSYEESMTQNDYREIPYGVAISGNYSLLFSAILMENLNILINIECGDACLYDKIQFEELTDIIFIDVLKFYNGTNISHLIKLKMDTYYRFYFGRVSPISKKLSSYTALTHSIIDKNQDIFFSIYNNNTVGSPKNVTSYRFGTVIEGEYCLNLTIFCDVKAVNIAYAIVEKQRIADGTDPNDDDRPRSPDEQNNRTIGIESFIPIELTIGMIVFAGSAVMIPIIIVQYRKKKNPIGI